MWRLRALTFFAGVSIRFASKRSKAQLCFRSSSSFSTKRATFPPNFGVLTMAKVKYKATKDGGFKVIVDGETLGFVFEDEDESSWFYIPGEDPEGEESDETFDTRTDAAKALMSEYEDPEDDDLDGLDDEDNDLGDEDNDLDGLDDEDDDLGDEDPEDKPPTKKEAKEAKTSKKKKATKPKAEVEQESKSEFPEGLPEVLQEMYLDCTEEEQQALKDLLVATQSTTEDREDAEDNEDLPGLNVVDFFLAAAKRRSPVSWKDLSNAWNDLSGEESNARTFKALVRKLKSGEDNLLGDVCLKVEATKDGVKIPSGQVKAINDRLKALKDDGVVSTVKDALK